jgi:hypothetical protein
MNARLEKMIVKMFVIMLTVVTPARVVMENLMSMVEHAPVSYSTVFKKKKMNSYSL